MFLPFSREECAILQELLNHICTLYPRESFQEEEQPPSKHLRRLPPPDVPDTSPREEHAPVAVEPPRQELPPAEPPPPRAELPIEVEEPEPQPLQEFTKRMKLLESVTKRASALVTRIHKQKEALQQKQRQESQIDEAAHQLGMHRRQLVRDQVKVRKKFGDEWFDGRLQHVEIVKDASMRRMLCYLIRYSDGDAEHLEEEEFLQALRHADPNRASELQKAIQAYKQASGAATVETTQRDELLVRFRKPLFRCQRAVRECRQWLMSQNEEKTLSGEDRQCMQTALQQADDAITQAVELLPRPNQGRTRLLGPVAPTKRSATAPLPDATPRPPSGTIPPSQTPPSQGSQKPRTQQLPQPTAQAAETIVQPSEPTSTVGGIPGGSPPEKLSPCPEQAPPSTASPSQAPTVQPSENTLQPRQSPSQQKGQVAPHTTTQGSLPLPQQTRSPSQKSTPQPSSGVARGPSRSPPPPAQPSLPQRQSPPPELTQPTVKRPPSPSHHPRTLQRRESPSRPPHDDAHGTRSPGKQSEGRRAESPAAPPQVAARGGTQEPREQQAGRPTSVGSVSRDTTRPPSALSSLHNAEAKERPNHGKDVWQGPCLIDFLGSVRIFYKPIGCPVYVPRSASSEARARTLAYWWQNADDKGAPGRFHTWLDVRESGLMLGTCGRGISPITEALAKHGRLEHDFVAVVAGDVADKLQCNGLSLMPELRRSRLHPDGVPSLTIFTKVASFQETESKRLFSLVWGRAYDTYPHQARLHLESLGHPIVGVSAVGALTSHDTLIRRRLFHVQGIHISPTRTPTSPSTPFSSSSSSSPVSQMSDFRRDWLVSLFFLLGGVSVPSLRISWPH